MFNSCGHALSQGDGRDFNPFCNWEAAPPGYSTCVSWESVCPTPARTNPGSQERQRLRECWQVWPIVGGAGNGLLEDSTSEWHVLKLACQGKGEGRTVCVCGCFKGLWDFNEDIKSLLLSPYNF